MKDKWSMQTVRPDEAMESAERHLPRFPLADRVPEAVGKNEGELDPEHQTIAGG